MAVTHIVPHLPFFHPLFDGRWKTSVPPSPRPTVTCLLLLLLESDREVFARCDHPHHRLLPFPSLPMSVRPICANEWHCKMLIQVREGGGGGGKGALGGGRSGGHKQTEGAFFANKAWEEKKKHRGLLTYFLSLRK